MNLDEKFKKFISENETEIYTTLKELSLIPAPSGLEDERAEYCKNKLISFGAEGVYIDEAKNVVFPINAEGSNKLTVSAPLFNVTYHNKVCRII